MACSILLYDLDLGSNWTTANAFPAKVNAQKLVDKEA